jgi:hypothetical protein
MFKISEAAFMLKLTGSIIGLFEEISKTKFDKHLTQSVMFR